MTNQQEGRSIMVAMTAKQRGTLARLRINHPRAQVFPVHEGRQKDLPLIRLRMRWPKTTIVRWFWITPEGRLIAGREATGHDRQRQTSSSGTLTDLAKAA